MNEISSGITMRLNSDYILIPFFFTFYSFHNFEILNIKNVIRVMRFNSSYVIQNQLSFTTIISIIYILLKIEAVLLLIVYI